MVVERRLSIVGSAAVAFALLTVLWNAFVRPTHRVRAGPAPDAPLVLVPTDSATAARDSAARATSPPPGPAPAAPTTLSPATPSPTDPGGPSYMVLLARSEIRRRIRASAGLTFLNDIVDASSDSALHRWDNRTTPPVRVFLPAATVANLARVSRCGPWRIRALGAGGGARALRARRRFGFRRSAVPVAHPVRRRANGADRPRVGRGRAADGRRGDARDVRSQGAAPRRGRPARDGAARDRTP